VASSRSLISGSTAIRLTLSVVDLDGVGGTKTFPRRAGTGRLEAHFFTRNPRIYFFGPCLLAHLVGMGGWVHPWEKSRPRTGTTATQGFFSRGAAFRGARNFFARILRVKSNAQSRSSHETTYYFFGSQCTPGVWQSLAAFAPGPVVLVLTQKVGIKYKKPL
jgi:hypothetical protein